MKKKTLKKRLRKIEKLSAEMITERNFKINRLEEELKETKEAKKTLGRWYADVSKLNEEINNKILHFVADLEKAIEIFGPDKNPDEIDKLLNIPNENPRI